MLPLHSALRMVIGTTSREPFHLWLGQQT
jgi:hypothetical protein